MWPEACRGAAKAWLVFIGPSPGKARGARFKKRWKRGHWEVPLHNHVWREPVDEWSPGFKVSMLPLVEHLVGRPFRDSGRLFAVANFDYFPSADARKVKSEWMEEGVPAVLEVLRLTNPRLIVPMD